MLNHSGLTWCLQRDVGFRSQRCFLSEVVDELWVCSMWREGLMCSIVEGGQE